MPGKPPWYILSRVLSTYYNLTLYFRFTLSDEPIGQPKTIGIEYVINYFFAANLFLYLFHASVQYIISLSWILKVTLASSWKANSNDTQLLVSISSALDHWFDRDFTEDDCINAGGNTLLKCPCGTPGFWNTNWYDQVRSKPSQLLTNMVSHLLIGTYFTKMIIT